MSKLQPCPCCESVEITSAGVSDLTWRIICDSCGLLMIKDCRHGAVVAWNTRPNVLDECRLVTVESTTYLIKLEQTFDEFWQDNLERLPNQDLEELRSAVEGVVENTPMFFA